MSRKANSKANKAPMRNSISDIDLSNDQILLISDLNKKLNERLKILEKDVNGTNNETDGIAVSSNSGKNSGLWNNLAKFTISMVRLDGHITAKVQCFCGITVLNPFNKSHGIGGHWKCFAFDRHVGGHAKKLRDNLRNDVVPESTQEPAEELVNVSTAMEISLNAENNDTLSGRSSLCL